MNLRLPWWLTLLSCALALAAAQRAAADDSATAAYDAFQKGDYRKARAYYEKLAKEKPDDARLRFNAGAAAYKQNDLTNAAGWFESALTTPDVQLQQKAYYNLGDTRYRLGDTVKDPKDKLTLWKESLTNFSAATRLDPADTNAAANFAYVQRQVEELQRQQPPPQSGDKQDKSDDKKDDKKNQDKNQQSQGDSSKDQKNDQQKDQNQQNQQDPSNSQDQKNQENRQQQQDQQSQQQQQQQQGGQSQEEQKKSEERKAAEQAKQDAAKRDQQEQKDKQNGQQEQQAKAQASQGEGSEGNQGEAEAMAEEAAKAGQMSPAQAARLLDSQKDNEKALLLNQQDKKHDPVAQPRKRKPW